MFSVASVCLFVCQHDNFRKILPEFEFGGRRPHPWVPTPQNVAVCWVTMQKINKLMWVWQAWQWATPPRLSLN